jgi:hypothetical protein
MYNLLFASSVLLSSLSIGAQLTPTASGSQECLQVQRAEHIFRRQIVRAVTEADSAGRWFRLHIGLPAIGDTTEVYYETDPVVCAAAARAMAARYGEDTVAPSAVHVLRVGTSRYIVFNNRRKGESWVYVVYDQHLNFVKGFTL